MAEIEESETRKEGQGFKLFGKTIPLEINKKVKEEIKVVQHQQQQEGESSGRSSSSSSSSSRPDKTIPCPRCKSMETKFCYFNNYNVNQPRHFCKGCQRYWTAGGSLRNVPVGAGRRKTKPACHGSIGFSGDCVFDASGTTVREIEFDRVVVEQWHVAAATAAASSGGFRHVFPGKRHCTGPAGQIC